MPPLPPGVPPPPTIAVLAPSWPGQPNIVYYSTLPPDKFNGGKNEINQALLEEAERPQKRRKQGKSVAQKRLAELREFKKEHGHTWAMRKKSARFYVKGLGNWCEKMRERKKKGNLESDVEKELVSLGFVWDWKDVPFKYV
jgi:hypothetical protein